MKVDRLHLGGVREMFIHRVREMNIQADTVHRSRCVLLAQHRMGSVVQVDHRRMAGL